MTSKPSLTLKPSIFTASILFIAVLTVLTELAATAIAQNPVPFVDQPLVPDAIAPGTAGFTLTVNGAGFVAASVVNWNGSPRATTLVSSSQLTAKILASDIAKASTATVTVVNPTPGGGVSNIQFFSIAVPKASVSFFLPAVSYGSGGSQSWSVAIADVNGDGKPDLIVSNLCEVSGCSSLVGAVGVLLGNGDGTFQAPVAYNSGGYYAYSVAVADVNGDDKPDIVVANCGPVGVGACQTEPAVVGVLLGNGDGTFQAALPYGSGGYGAYSVAVGDVNGDGKLDLVVGNLTSSSTGPEGGVAVLLGNGDGTFQAAVPYDSGGEAAESVALADVNGDGKLDILVANICASPTACGTAQSSQGGVGVLLGNGDGTFRPVVTYDSGGYAADSLAVADVNGDGKPDLLVFNIDNANGENSTSGSVGVLLGNGDGTFQAAVTYITGGPGGNVGSVTVADVNGDGKLDLVATNGNSGISVLLGNGDGIFQAAMEYDSGGSLGLAVADLNGDGLPDVAVTNGAISNGLVGVLLHVGTTPTTTTVTSAPNPSFFGQFVTFSAAVTSKSGTPTGAVTFFENSTELGSANLVDGKASISISTLAAGSYPITAVYQGSLTFNSSESAPLTQTVKSARAATSTALASTPNPSTYGQAITFTATVTSSGGTPPNFESVIFYNGPNVLGTSYLTGGIASLTKSSLGSGIHTISAAYGGDANFSASISPVLQQVVDTSSQSPTTTSLASSLNPSIYGRKVTWTATVTPTGKTTPTGKVNFTWDGFSIGTATLNATGVATLTRSNLNADPYPLTAVYVGDANNGPSASAILNQVITETTSAATLSSSANPSTQGQAVTFTATITSPTVTPTGPVTFTAGTTVLGTAQLSGGKAKFTTSTLAVGSTKVTATYHGDSSIAESSATVTQTVQHFRVKQDEQHRLVIPPGSAKGLSTMRTAVDFGF